MPHSLNCTCYICYICYWSVIVIAGEKKSVFKNGTSAEAPSLLSFLMSTEAFAASSSWAHSTWPPSAARCSGVQPQHRRSGTRGAARDRRRSLSSPRPRPSRSGRPRRRPSPRGTPRSPGGRGLLPSAALPSPRRVGPGSFRRGAGGPGRPGGRRCPPRRRCGRLGARRNETEMTMFLFSFFFLWSFWFL